MDSLFIWDKLLRDELENLIPHVEDDLRTGAFDMATQTVTIKQAWNDLQAVPSYVEQQAASFATEPVSSYEERVLALSHTDECWQVLHVSYDARYAYRLQWSHHCPSCHGTGEREVGSLSYEDPPELANCNRCVKRGLCPRCGATGFATDGCYPCLICKFEVGEDGVPEQAWCTCGADSVLYAEGAAFLPDFPDE